MVQTTDETTKNCPNIHTCTYCKVLLREREDRRETMLELMKINYKLRKKVEKRRKNDKK